MRFKIFSGREMIATVKYAEHAAVMVAQVADGGTIKVNGRIVWREGKEAATAWESYDNAAATMQQRVRAHHDESLAKMGWQRDAATGTMHRIAGLAADRIIAINGRATS